MRFRPAIAVLLLTAVPAFAQPFTLELTGGTVDFGAAPLHIAVLSSNGGGTSGNVARAVPPASLSCSPTEAVTLAGPHLFAILGTTKHFGHLSEVELVFSGPPFGNQKNLGISSANWELTGIFAITIRDTVTGRRCSRPAGTSGEYQFAGPPLSGWPHDCANPTNAGGQSPGPPDS